MADGIPPLPPEIQKAIAEANTIQEVVIRFNPVNNQVQFQGPTNRVLAYGMLMFGVECLMAQSNLFKQGQRTIP